VRADLQWLYDHHWHHYLQRHLRYHGKLLGICGGFQMLGQMIHDPDGIEGPPGSSKALACLDMETSLQKQKQLHNKSGTMCLNSEKVTGYEIHAGIRSGAALEQPAIIAHGTGEGAISEDRQIIGTYFHGLFEQQTACDAWLQWAALEQPQSENYLHLREQSIDRLADAMEQHLDINSIMNMLRV